MKDRVIVITGASSGIGATLAELVSKKGARTVLVARREKELHDVAKRCGDALAVVADITKLADVERVAKEAIARFGGFDVWINNAGRGISQTVMELTEADLDEMFTMNVKSVVYGMQTAVRHFRERGGGHIINVSSMLGRVPFAPIRSAYSASKHAMNSLSANLRMELGATDPKIAVSVVHPGVVATEFGTKALHGGADSRQLPNAQSAEDVAAIIANTIETRRADVYTRPEAQKVVVSYYSAEDMAAAEQAFGHRRP